MPTLKIWIVKRVNDQSQEYWEEVQ